jgi:hypothetical protein
VAVSTPDVPDYIPPWLLNDDPAVPDGPPKDWADLAQRWSDRLERLAPAEGFATITCRACSEPIKVPLGPDFWEPAQGGTVRSRHGIICPACKVTIWAVGFDDLAG